MGGPFFAADVAAVADVELLEIADGVGLGGLGLSVIGMGGGEGDIAAHEIEGGLPVLIVFDELGFAVFLGGDGGGAELAVGEQFAEALLGFGVVAEVVGDRADAERDGRVGVIEVGGFGIERGFIELDGLRGFELMIELKGCLPLHFLGGGVLLQVGGKFFCRGVEDAVAVGVLANVGIGIVVRPVDEKSAELCAILRELAGTRRSPERRACSSSSLSFCRSL